MAKVENELDIYCAVGNSNNQRQEKEFEVIMKKRNSAGWKLISISAAIVDTKNQFKSLSIFVKGIITNTIDICYFSLVIYMAQKFLIH